MACFALCTDCNRHVRRTESACPFCGGRALVTAPCMSNAPGSRRAVLFAAAAAAAGTIGCSSEDHYGAPVNCADGSIFVYDEGCVDAALPSRGGRNSGGAGGVIATGGAPAGGTGGTIATGGDSAGGTGGALIRDASTDVSASSDAATDSSDGSDVSTDSGLRDANTSGDASDSSRD